jgi:hypothetical protein
MGNAACFVSKNKNIAKVVASALKPETDVSEATTSNVPAPVSEATTSNVPAPALLKSVSPRGSARDLLESKQNPKDYSLPAESFCACEHTSTKPRRRSLDPVPAVTVAPVTISSLSMQQMETMSDTSLLEGILRYEYKAFDRFLIDEFVYRDDSLLASKYLAFWLDIEGGVYLVFSLLSTSFTK